jgi:hypothetical protein
MITLKKTAEQLENEQKLEFLNSNYPLLKDFIDDFYDESMLQEILTEGITNNDTVTINALSKFVEQNEEDYEQWKEDQNDTRPDTNEEREER